MIINLVAGASDGHAKNISLLRAPGLIGVAPLYDLATGMAYDSKRVERSVAVSIGGERHASRIRRRQWDKAAAILNLEPNLLIERVTKLAQDFPGAFANALDDLGQAVPGIAEVADRAVPALVTHAKSLQHRL